MIGYMDWKEIRNLTCWVIYKRKNELSTAKAMKFVANSYEEISKIAKEWVDSRDDIEIIDVTESVYEED